LNNVVYAIISSCAEVKFFMLDIIRDFGYLFVFFGTFLEGETTLVMAGVLIHEGSLSFPKVVVISLFASYLSHISFYFFGYLGGETFLRKFRHQEEKVFRIFSLIRRYETFAIFLFQYILGLRFASAMAFGLAKTSPLKYGLLQLISCLIWASLFLLLGYLFSYSVQSYVNDIKKLLLLVMVFGIFLVWGAKRTFNFYFKRRF